MLTRQQHLGTVKSISYWLQDLVSNDNRFRDLSFDGL